MKGELTPTLCDSLHNWYFILNSNETKQNSFVSYPIPFHNPLFFASKIEIEKELQNGLLGLATGRKTEI